MKFYTKVTPRYKHDCNQCAFIGYVGQIDLYICTGASVPQIVARESSDDPDYRSGFSSPLFNKAWPQIREALKSMTPPPKAEPEHLWHSDDSL